MPIRNALHQLLERQDLSRSAMREAMQKIMVGACDDIQIAAFLVALRMKGETIDEILSLIHI